MGNERMMQTHVPDSEFNTSFFVSGQLKLKTEVEISVCSVQSIPHGSTARKASDESWVDHRTVQFFNRSCHRMWRLAGTERSYVLTSRALHSSVFF